MTAAYRAMTNASTLIGYPAIAQTFLHAGTFWYVLIYDSKATEVNARYIRLYGYAPNATQPRITTNPQWIRDALTKAKRHSMHECDPFKPCVAAPRTTNQTIPSASNNRPSEPPRTLEEEAHNARLDAQYDWLVGAEANEIASEIEAGQRIQAMLTPTNQGEDCCPDCNEDCSCDCHEDDDDE